MKAKLIKNIQVTYLVNHNERNQFHFWIDEDAVESLVHSWVSDIPEKDSDSVYIGINLSDHNSEAQKEALSLILKRFEGIEVIFPMEISKEQKKATKSPKKEAQ
jgi:hypothetical protein